jgi:hypothetical protein
MQTGRPDEGRPLFMCVFSVPGHQYLLNSSGGYPAQFQPVHSSSFAHRRERMMG